MTNSRQHQAQVQLDRYGLKLTARLSEGTNSLPHDITERLRVARIQALAQHKLAQVRTAPLMQGGGAAALGFGDEGRGFWSRLGTAIPLAALVVGLIVINVTQNDILTNELAEVDTALLIDDLPPAAYADPGFVQFLKTNRSLPQ